MVSCEICKLEFNNTTSLSHHISTHDISLQEYYDRYIGGNCKCLECNEEVIFKGLTKGYSKFCSTDCSYKYRTGKPKIYKEKMEVYIKCEICGKMVVSLKALSQHLIKHHEDITSQIYYDKYIRKNVGEGKCLECEKDTKFLGLVKGYQRYCSNKCANSSVIRRRESSNNIKNLWKDESKKDEIINKIKNTIKNFWNDEKSIYNTEIYRNKLSESQKNKWIKYRNETIYNIFEKIGYKLLSEYKGAQESVRVKCLICNYEFDTVWNYLQYRKSCPNCSPNGISFQEKEVSDYVNSILCDEKIITNNRETIHPKELDILIPTKNIAIEFNGLYWHSEKMIKNRFYHYDKTIICANKNLKLIHIFEDEWLFKKDIVKNRLKSILGIVDKNKTIYARKCVIKEIDTKTKNDFLNKYHLQGFDISSIRLGAFYNDQLVAVMTFTKGNVSKGSQPNIDIWELNRFCSDYNYHIPGIASKLLSYFKKNYKWKQIFSYADRRWSDGNLYYKLGFNFEYFTKPNYWYIKNYKRIHRFNLRKGIEEKEINVTEKELRISQGYDIIWDCGHYKFSMLNSTIC